MVFIKNIILYDNYQNVVGFVELKNVDNVTRVRTKHNLSQPNLITTVNNQISGDTITPALNLEDETVACIIQKNAAQITTVASGIINPQPLVMAPKPFSRTLATLPPLKSILNDTAKAPIERETPLAPKTAAAKEIDEVLRAVCQIDDKKRGLCTTCPYRDFFFGDEVGSLQNQKTMIQ